MQWINEESETDISVVIIVRMEQKDFDFLRSIHSFSRFGVNSADIRIVCAL